MTLIFEQNITSNKEAFKAKVITICEQLQINPDWLMVVMQMESGMNPKAVNPKSNATGLIQFMPSTAVSLGTTVTALYNMTNVQQLDFVLKYFKGASSYTTRRPIFRNLGDLYLFVFFPIAINHDENWVLHASNLSAETIANANKIIDINKDGKINVGEFYQYIRNYLRNKGLTESLIAFYMNGDVLYPIDNCNTEKKKYSRLV